MSSVFSLLGQGLKLNSRADIETHLAGVDPTVIEEIHLGGNTIGVEAALALADFLAKTTRLRVRRPHLRLTPQPNLTDAPAPTPGRELRRHLHRPPDLGDPARAFRHLRRADRQADARRDRPERQRVRRALRRPARPLPLLRALPPRPQAQQQRPRPRRRHRHRRRATHARELASQGHALEPPDRHLRPQSARGRLRHRVGGGAARARHPA